MVKPSQEAEIRICIQITLTAKVWMGPDAGEPSNWEATRKPTYSQSVCLARVIDPAVNGGNALLSAENIAEMTSHCGGFIVANLAGKL